MDSADIVNRLSQIPEVDGDDPIPAFFKDDEGVLHTIVWIEVVDGHLEFQGDTT